MTVGAKAVPAWAKPLADTVADHAAKLEEHSEHIAALKTVYSDINEATIIVKKIWAAIKWGAPTVISAAVTAGYLNGDFGKLLHAIFG